MTDINDNSPAFSRQTYLARIVENNPKGHYIVQVNATDKDTGNNSRIVYSLTKHVSSYLHIDSSSGVITASRSLDREQMQQVQRSTCFIHSILFYSRFLYTFNLFEGRF